MKLLTKVLMKKLPKLRSTAGTPPNERKIICKFFSIESQQRWYVLEGDPKPLGDYELYVYMTGNGCPKFTHRLLSDLQSTLFYGRTAVERDLHFEGHTLQEVLDETTF